MRRLMHVLGAGLSMALVRPVLAAPLAAKDEAMAMVKSAVAFIKKDGPAAAYAEISNKSCKFVDRDLYVVVYRLDDHVLAHGANAKLVGTDQSDAKDVDGKAFVQERIALAQKQPSFWQAYKFKNPVTDKVEDKQTYCENTAVCAGVYKF